jgi:hypothetical protein
VKAIEASEGIKIPSLNAVKDESYNNHSQIGKKKFYLNKRTSGSMETRSSEKSGARSPRKRKTLFCL